jgi:predicted choloylglycine hydrolase
MTFQAIAEDLPGPKWQSLFKRLWPSYEPWFLQQGERSRPYYLTSVRALREHMPELLPTYEKLVELAGGDDLAARFLSSYCPPPYLTSCSQAVWSGNAPLLVRNYDYSPFLFEGVTLKTAWNGRQVIAMSDCLWGVLDGVNDHGLAVSLSFGGRPDVGPGFGVPLVLRYILEFCSTTREAVEVLKRVPVHMTYNVTVLDRTGHFETAYLAPDRPTLILPVAVTTNHQQRVEWEEHARSTGTVERQRFLEERLQNNATGSDEFVQAFLEPPVYSIAYEKGSGTVYTAVYSPTALLVDYLWPDCRWRQSFARFEEGSRTIKFPGESLEVVSSSGVNPP